MEAEVWKDIPGYEGAYQVSSLGRVRSLDRVGKSVSKHGSEYSRVFKGRVLSPGVTNGYLKVGLFPGKTYQLVHRLVASAFLGACPEGFEVRHLDGDRTNNRLDNLAYGTHVENEADKVLHGVQQKRCRLTEEQAREIRKRSESNTALGEEYGVSDVTISNIRLGKTYRWAQ